MASLAVDYDDDLIFHMDLSDEKERKKEIKNKRIFYAFLKKNQEEEKRVKNPKDLEII
jgi:hypothetical protein